MTGAATGSMTGAVTGSMTGAATGSMTGAVTGTLTASATGTMTITSSCSSHSNDSKKASMSQQLSGTSLHDSYGAAVMQYKQATTREAIDQNFADIR